MAKRDRQSIDEMMFLKGSAAIAELVSRVGPGVVAAYPITPQTGIIEYLAKLKISGQADYSFLQAESEHSALSMVLGAAAAGALSYTATSSQGMLHMIEIVYNLAGLRLPVVMTCANRSISAPINIWNDHQDAMAVRDAGWLMFFAENNQEAIEQHWLAFALSQQLNLPVMVNVDGFRLTHASEPVAMPSEKLISKIVKQRVKNLLEVNNPKTIGHFTMPIDYETQRLSLGQTIADSLVAIEKKYFELMKIWQPIKKELSGIKTIDKNDLATVEYYGPNKAKTVIVAMGSIVGELKDLADKTNKEIADSLAILKIKLYRPFPEQDVIKYLKNAQRVIVIDRAPGLGSQPPLFTDISSVTSHQVNARLVSLIIGLGGNVQLTELEKILK
ncbi:MAG TPA: pyruvate ferredoxin oxidoreductase [bacterium]|nr:pyruvate ferredoxin oxidoreductase [bacterium]